MAFADYHGWFDGIGDIGFVSDSGDLFREGLLLQALGIKPTDASTYNVKYTISANDGGFYGFAENGDFVGSKEPGKFITAIVVIVSVNAGFFSFFTSLPNLDCQIKPRGGDWQSLASSDNGKTRTYTSGMFVNGIEGLKIIHS